MAHTFNSFDSLFEYDWDDSFLLSSVAAETVAPNFLSPGEVVINELLPNPPGSDPAMQDVELRGEAGTTFSGFLISIENDGINGTVERLETVSGTFDANGLLVVTIADLENPSFTLILAETATGLSIGDDLDVGDTGTIDTSALGIIYDALGVADSAADLTNSYAPGLGGVALNNISSEPSLAFRDGLSGEWYYLRGSAIYDDTNTSVDTTEFMFGNPSVSTFGTMNAVNPDDVMLFSDVPELASFLSQDDSFATVLAAASDDDYIFLTDPESTGDVGVQTVNADNLNIIANEGFEAELTLGTATDIQLNGTNDANISGNALDNNITGSEGENTINGGAGADFIRGQGGNDMISGEAGIDVLVGGAGDDIIDGGGDNDILRGSAGADTFVFTTGTGKDVIGDFEDGIDLIDLTGTTAMSMADLTLVQVGTNVSIALGADRIILLNTDAADLTAADFEFMMPASTPAIEETPFMEFLEHEADMLIF